MKVFWSWQSDTHQPSGRYFVRDVLQLVCGELAESPDVEPSDRPEVDHDTLDVAGSPPIADTILRKIREAAVFVADVTPVAKTTAGKHLANPNVMIELGYALAVLGHERIVLVMNTAEGASVKNLPFDLKHWRKPISYALRRDASDEGRAKAVNDLATALRQTLVPSLKVAAVVEREKRRQTTRAPELAVEFQEGDRSSATLQLSQRAEVRTAKSLDEINLETPLLPIPPANSAPRLGGARRSLSALGLAPPPSQWTQEETEGYNRFVQHYYNSWERHLTDLTEWSLVMQRTFSVKLMLTNRGTAPATSIDVELAFPPGVVLFEDGKLPPKPEAPQPPPLVPLGAGQGFAMPVPPKFNFDHLTPQRVRATVVNPDENTVRFSAADLKHRHQVNIATFVAGFPILEDIKPFAVSYVVTANEPIDPITGELQFQVELDGVVVSTDDGGLST